jgi:hypothetical protein
MADLKSLQKKIAVLLYEQLSQYFNQVQIISYKPSASGTVSGKFTGDRRNYTFILKNNQVQYLPANTKMDSTALAVRPNKGVIQCSGSNHPCKGEKGTRCVPQNQSCKQRESSDEGIARLKDISAVSKEITALVTGNTAPESSTANKQPLGLPEPKNKASSSATSTNQRSPEFDQDISLYDFLKYYSPWNPKGSEGYENAKLHNVRRRGGLKTKQTKVKQANQTATTETRAKPDPWVRAEREPRVETTKPDSEASTQPNESKPKGLNAPKPKGLNAPKQNQSTQSRSQTNQSKQESTPPKQSPKTNNPYEFLGVNPKDFPDEAALYKASEKAYRNLARKYHPDNGGDPAMMVELNNLMNRLKSIEKVRKAKERGDSRISRRRK